MVTEKMKYITDILVENHNQSQLRAHKDEDAARRYVEKLAKRLSRLRDAGRTDMFVALAEIYEANPSGAMHVIANFSGFDSGDSTWDGWS